MLRAFDENRLRQLSLQRYLEQKWKRIATNGQTRLGANPPLLLGDMINKNEFCNEVGSGSLGEECPSVHYDKILRTYLYVKSIPFRCSSRQDRLPCSGS